MSTPNPISGARSTTAEKPKEKLDAQIKSADMSDEMQQQAIEVASEAMEKYSIEKVRSKIEKRIYSKSQAANLEDTKDIAQYIKREFDLKAGATWHCIVGRNFGSFVTHETRHFTYFYLGHCAILLFKTQ